VCCYRVLCVVTACCVLLPRVVCCYRVLCVVTAYCVLLPRIVCCYRVLCVVTACCVRSIELLPRNSIESLLHSSAPLPPAPYSWRHERHGLGAPYSWFS